MKAFLIEAGIIALGLLVAYGWGYNVGADAVEADWDRYRAVVAEKQADLEATYRGREQKLTQEAKEITDGLHYDLTQNTTELTVALDDVRAGNLQLRSELRGCQARVSRTTGIAIAPSRDDEASNPGLSEADVELALRLAADADAVAHRLNACQAFVNTLEAQF